MLDVMTPLVQERSGARVTAPLASAAR